MSTQAQRIRDLQFLLNLPESGKFDLATLKACAAQLPSRGKAVEPTPEAA